MCLIKSKQIWAGLIELQIKMSSESVIKENVPFGNSLKRMSPDLRWAWVMLDK